MGTNEFDVEGNPAMDWHPRPSGRGGTPAHFMLEKLELSTSLMCQKACIQTLY